MTNYCFITAPVPARTGSANQTPRSTRGRQHLVRGLLAVGLVLAPVAMAQTLPGQDPNATPWLTKAALLQAARAGEFRGLPEVRFDIETETAPLTRSVLQVLRAEYGVPPLPADRNCVRAALSEVRRLLTALTDGAVSTLGDRPPDFRRENNPRAIAQQLNDVVPRLGTGGGFCETQMLGLRKPHPYGAALKQFSAEFEAATVAWVEEERARRIQAHETANAQQRARDEQQAADRQKADAERKAAEQRRIDAERARIEAEQERRKQRDKNRVAG